MGRIQREEVAFPSSPDTRFGGNIARANVGTQYPRGGHDIRYEEYMAPHRVDYTRNVPRQTGTPNFRGPIQGTSTFPHELQHQGAPRQHPNPRMRGMGGGLQPKSQLRRPESFTNMDMFNRPDLSFRYSHMDPEKVASRDDTILGDESIRGTWRRMQDARRADEMDEYGYLEGAPRQRTTFTEGYMDPADFNEMYGGVYDDEILRSGGLGGLQEQAGIDPSDWRSILRILEAGGDPGTETQTAMADERNWDSMPDLADWKQGIGPGARKPIQTIPIFPGTFGDSLEGVINDQTLGNQWAETAQMGGYGYSPGPKSYDDIYEGLDIIDMEPFPGAGYEPGDEYEFDYKRDRFEDLLPGKWPSYVARGGLMSLRR